MGKGLQDELRQTKPFGSRAEEAYVALMRTADQLQWKGAELMKKFDVSPTQFNALRILRGAGAKGLPCSEIGERMVTRDSDITRLLDRLERRGLAERCREGKDRRVIMGRITAAGLQLLKKMDKPLEEFHRNLLGRMEESHLTSLLALLQEARELASDD
ncbi:MAG TPA: MarR family transcriptional regulator [Terriglobales bacterium]|nr:MarR family transcriptional regulator [Terriglobales bacterium]